MVHYAFGYLVVGFLFTSLVLWTSDNPKYLQMSYGECLIMLGIGVLGWPFFLAYLFSTLAKGK